MIGGGDPVRRQLPVGFEQGRIQRKRDTGTRKQLALERIAMNVDHRRREDQARGINLLGAVARHIEARNDTVRDPDRQAFDGAGQDDAGVCDDLGHGI